MQAVDMNNVWFRLPLLSLPIVIQASALHSGGGYGGTSGFHKHSDATQETTPPHRQQLPPPKHFIVALIDDLGGYNVPWRNAEQTMSDDILRLSTQEGMRLENFYTFKYCSPTRSSFLSARFPIHVNERNGGVCDAGGIDLRMKLLPEKLRSAGFRSYMLGKGHIGARSDANLPINRGFDHHLGFLGGGEDHYTQRVSAGVDLWSDYTPAYDRNGTYSCYLYSDEAVALIEDHAKKYADKGMFMYLPYHDVHEPYEAEPRFRDPALSDVGRQTMQAMVACVSEGTGNVSRALKAAGMWDTTLFLWSSDNGGPQYWLGNNYPYRGGKGTDFEGGVATAAFVTGGALPSHLYGQVSNSPMHVADLHFTICLLAGVSDHDCRDDAITGVPPIDGVDLREAFQAVNVTRPIAQGGGASAGTQEVVLSGMVVGAYIDFNLSNGGPWKFVQNTTHVLKNSGSPKGSGYWTGPRWPVGHNHSVVGGAGQMEPDPGCPAGGCLFNLRLDRTEHREFSTEQPVLQAIMAKRMAELRAGAFQTSSNYTAGYDNCQTVSDVVMNHHGFVAPCCAKGTTWSRSVRCGASDGPQNWTVFSPANYRGTWTCNSSTQTVVALDDAAADGGAIGFARLEGVQQPPAGADGFTLHALVKLGDGGDTAGCGYRTGGVVVGMGSSSSSASSELRDDFDGYSVELSPPGCNGTNSRIVVQRFDAGGRNASPSVMRLASAAFSTKPLRDGWISLRVSTNATHIIAGLTEAAPLVAAALLPNKPVRCSNEIHDDREPWEPPLAPSHGRAGDACAVGLFQHRVQVEWREVSFTTN